MLAKSPMDEKIAALIQPSVEGMGFRLVRVRLMGGRRPTLQIMAERPDGSMEVDDCAEVSRMLSALLDVEDPIDREYVLEVSSPGIDRPLTRLEDFERYAGFEAKLETQDLIEGRKRFRGALQGVEGGDVVIRVEIDGEEAEPRLPFEALADAKLVLTDELVAESLKGRKGRVEDGGVPASAADGAEIDVEGLETEPAQEDLQESLDDDPKDDAEDDAKRLGNDEKN